MLAYIGRSYQDEIAYAENCGAPSFITQHNACAESPSPPPLLHYQTSHDLAEDHHTNLIPTSAHPTPPGQCPSSTSPTPARTFKTPPSPASASPAFPTPVYTSLSPCYSKSKASSRKSNSAVPVLQRPVSRPAASQTATTSPHTRSRPSSDKSQTYMSNTEIHGD